MGKILQGNSIDILKTLDGESVDCIITSPPYYQLRRYGTNDEEIGQEENPKKYIDNLMNVFNECYRVLKKDGTMFINISDTYNGTGVKSDLTSKERYNDYSQRKNSKEIKKKSLIGIPSRLEIALIDSGWILRNEIIWHKPNAMPSSVNDRFTVDFEKIFFLTKNEMYYFKQIKEPMKTTDTTRPRGSKGVIGELNSGRRKQDVLGKETYTGFNDRYQPPKDFMRNKRTVWSISTEANDITHFAMYPKELVETMLECGAKQNGIILDPFAGAGTTLKIAKQKGYDYIGIELYEENCKIIEERLSKTPIQMAMDLGEL